MSQNEDSRIFIVEGKPAYQAVRLIGRGGSSRCYQVRKIGPDGSPGRYYVIKMFWPGHLADSLEEQGEDRHAALRADRQALRQEFDRMLQMFWAEPARSMEINQAAGGGRGNYPWVFHEETVPGRQDLLLIDTENGFTAEEFVQNQYSGIISSQYVILCLTIVSKLLECLKGIHRGGMLHLDVKPQNVYLVTQDSRLSSSSAFSVKLLDLASAAKKASFAKGAAFPENEWDNATFSDGYSDPLLRRFFEAAEEGMLDKFLRKNVIDERVDWYSAAAVLYHLLTGADAAALEGGCVSLPRKGMLENHAFRTDLEEVLTRALGGMPYTGEELAEERFSRDIQRLLLVAGLQALESAGTSDGREQKDIAVSGAGAWAALKAPAPGTAAEADGDGPGKINTEKLFAFSPEEEAEYRRQITVLCQRLPSSKDCYDTYSCHSLPHVREVMGEADRLFGAMRPWLSAYIPADRMESARLHLLLAAKLHDIGMAGTENMHLLLDEADRLYYHADGAGEKKMDVRAACGRMASLAESESMVTGTCKLILNTMPDGSLPAGKLKQALAAFHDEIQSAIRKRHAETSGRYILKHRGELTARYGPETDMGKTALIAAHHSNSVPDDGGKQPFGSLFTEAYCRRFLLRYGTEEESERLCVPASLEEIFALASLLRLADCRRSGSKMCMIDLSPISVDRTPGGRFVLYRLRSGVRENLAFNISLSIILSEACCDFGAVALTGDGENGWRMTHEMTLKYADDASIRELFQSNRIPSYVDELSSAMLKPSGRLTHELRVFAPGLDAAAAAAWAERIPLKQGYGVAVIPEPS